MKSQVTVLYDRLAPLGGLGFPVGLGLPGGGGGGTTTPVAAKRPSDDDAR